MRLLTAILPPASIVLATLLAALPWGLPAQSRFVLPLLPFVVLHYWVMRRPGSVPEWLAFACGLTLDVLTNGPLGFWSLIYLAGFAVGHWESGFETTTPLARAVSCLLALAVMACAEWALSSIYFWELADWRPLVVGTLWAALAYPLVALLMRVIDLDRPRRINARLERGA